MKVFNSNLAGVVCGVENNKDLFIRRTVFSRGYFETDFHKHPNSFEYYYVESGKLKFQSERETIEGYKGSLVYFEQKELHKIIEVSEDTSMLLIKKLGSIKGN